MRGRHEEQEVMLAHVDMEGQSTQGPSSSYHQDGGRRGAGTSLSRVRQDVLQGGPGLGATGAIAEGLPSDLPLLGAQ